MEVKITAVDVLAFCKELEPTFPAHRTASECMCPQDGKGHHTWCTFANERDALCKIARILHNLALEGDRGQRRGMNE